jgi:hypothetical protein
MLPRELWIEILKIKWYRARKNRLEKILKFPVKIFSDEEDSTEFMFTSSNHEWFFYGERSWYSGYYHWLGNEIDDYTYKY